MVPIKIIMMGGANRPFSANLQIASSTDVINLRTLADQAGYDGAANTEIYFGILPDVFLYAGITTGNWPAGKEHNLVLNVHGKLYGQSGIGGAAAYNDLGISGWNGNGNPGSPGGDAIYASAPLTVNIISTGEVIGGGGGGGGGAGWGGMSTGPEPEYSFGSGGTGGNGFPFQTAGNPKQDVGAGNGGTGGGPAAVGASGAVATKVGASYTKFSPGIGGAAGWAIRKNGQLVTVNNVGVITGTVA